ncbi:MAG: hypothetical protein AAGU05_06670, partial [Anaerolineaceae bacterium]
IENQEEERIREVIQKEKAFRDAFYNLAVFYSHVQRFDLALRTMSHLIKHVFDVGDKAYYYFVCGQMMEQQRDYAVAVKFYRLAYTLEPSDQQLRYFIHNNLGYSLNQLDQYEEGERFCRVAIRIDPRRLNAHKNLGLALEGQKKYVPAVESYLRAVMVDPVDRRALQLLQDLLERQPQILSEHPEFSPQVEEAVAAVRAASEGG